MWCHTNSATSFREERLKMAAMFSLDEKTLHNITTCCFSNTTVAIIEAMNSTQQINTTEYDMRAILESGPVYMYTAERVVLATYLFLVTFLSSTVNCIFMYLVFTDSMFHTPYMAILVCLCITDIIVVFTMMLPPFFFVAIGQLPLSGYSNSCLISRVFYLTPFVSQNFSIAFLSVERLMYFYKPLLYQRVVSIRNIIYLEFIFLVLSLLYVILTSMDGEIYASPLILACKLYGLSYYLPLHFSLIYCPVFLIVAVSILGLLRLIWKHKRAIQTQQVGTAQAGREESGEQESVNLIANIKTGIRIVACMSATYYLTYFPVIVLLFVIMSRINNVDLELGNYPKERLLIRGIYFSIGLGNVFNSYVYICINKQLKKKMMRLLKRSRSVVHVSGSNETSQETKG